MIELLTGLAWTGDILALLAAYLITKGWRISFLIFVLADLFLMGVQIYNHIWSQFFLFLCFTIINLLGWARWSPQNARKGA